MYLNHGEVNMPALYSAGQIDDRLTVVNTRQILDLAEKELITPYRDTTGAGSPRLYDFQNVFEISVCMAVRGRIPAGIATHDIVRDILEYIREEQAGEENPPPFDMIIINYEGGKDFHFYKASYDQSFENILKDIKKVKLQHFCNYIVEVNALWDYLKSVFD